ncbi:hypothetical protein PI23P_03852 [Polaribacter irgensii 23-P]|jgi:hypothetical protein|uniref:Uncharacterized protein n=1 Tax=Polaribacter irgensii 23-P TaxID=313594 RepID=A4BXA7_9FLAO|nr:hypothetical protein [Polaribacter irgensii]EAR13598.1 hypothetical protein PI23P_03852 [Polaribacter irgensii 23-P]
MKTAYRVAILLLISISLSFTNKIIVSENAITATFMEITEEDYFKFITPDKQEVLFYDIDEEVEISLYDDTYLNKKFEITWVEKEIELSDDEGDLTGEKKKVKSIISLKLLN